MTRKNLDLGQEGERKAADFLRSKGYRILQRNFRCAAGEIDIIAEDRKTVVFVEVKTRSGEGVGHPSLAVTPAKQKKIAQVARSFLARYNVDDRDLRFDVVAIVGLPDQPESWKIDLFTDAFRI